MFIVIVQKHSVTAYHLHNYIHKVFAKMTIGMVQTNVPCLLQLKLPHVKLSSLAKELS